MRQTLRRAAGVIASGAVVAGIAAGFALGGPAAQAVPSPDPSSGCHLANGIKHVIEITFDNVHYNRDNPNVLSDLEQIPALESFITDSGTLLSNNHTPLIAHTADDTLTTYTGLYGDRQGQGITNDYEVYKPDGTLASESSFAYWTGTFGVDPFPNMPYSADVPAAGSPPQTPPAPWVPFTRAGCDVGDVSTANMELENLNPDLQNVFGGGSPEVAQYTADSDKYKDQETNDYLGLAIHCARGSAICANAEATKYGQTSPSHTAVADLLPDEPGGYVGYQALFGHKYLQPVLAGAATSGDSRVVGGASYPVIDAAGNLVDLSGNEIDGQYVHTPGFPGFGPISAAQSLAYVADMQEVGVPVTYAYISDAHESKPGQKGCSNDGEAQGPGDICFQQNLAADNTAFATFFKRLADDGINPSNTLFVFSSDEGDHFAGANVGRSVDVTPKCTGTPDEMGYTCSYPAGTIGEEAVDIHGLLANQLGDTTPFYNEPQGNAVYIIGNPGPYTTTTRTLERDFAKVTADDAYDGGGAENVAQYEADPAVEALLHFVDADPNRTPSFTVFPKPDFYLASGTSDGCPNGTTAANAAAQCVSIDNYYAWDHGYYAPEINNNWLGLVGPGVRNDHIDGSTAAAGPSSAGTANSSPKLDTSLTNPGTWADESDIRPTIMALTGLRDDYVEDGRVLTEDLSAQPWGTRGPWFEALAACYKQLNSSVGEFGTDMLVADTAALKTGSSGDDSQYDLVSVEIKSLGLRRDALATEIKDDLYRAEFLGEGLDEHGGSELERCQSLLAEAGELAAGQPLPSLGGGGQDAPAQLQDAAR
jgi:hypothetical protein